MKRVAFILASLSLLASCVEEELGVPKSQSGKPGLFFTASISDQDFFGTGGGMATRSDSDEMQRVSAGFYDLPVEGRDNLVLSVSTVDGMFGKPSSSLFDGGAVHTRGSMLYELAYDPMYVMETGIRADGTTLSGDPYKVVTKDGTSWGGEFIPHNSGTVSNLIRAAYPASERALFNPLKQTLEYSTPANAADQIDLLYAEREVSATIGQAATDTVHLTFDHILTAVRFKIGSRQLPVSVIKNITISGITTRGTFDCANHIWTVEPGAVEPVSCDLDFNATGAENMIINSGDNTFMLLPQALTGDAKVTIQYEDYTEGEDSAQGGAGEITASLYATGTPAWEPGQCITYTLTDSDYDNEYILEVDSPEDIGPEGGTRSVNVLSYRHVNGVRTPVRWTVQSYSSDGGRTWMSGGSSNVPKGMAIYPTEGTSDKETRVDITLNGSTVKNGPHRDFLRYKTPLGYESGSFDLSTHDYLNRPCLQTTANCYVVDAPGRYRFPTVYGNGIVDGKTNSAAYGGSDTFVNHKGGAITSPRIKNSGVSFTHATLVWEDVKDLINPASIKLVDESNAVEFEILADNIDQGNAVIALMDGNDVVWSWHIWVTDQKSSLASPVSFGNQYGEAVDFMPLTLGWCSTASGSGLIGREAAVRITMPSHPTSRASFRIRQTSTETTDIGMNIEGNAPYYNWGRKDPFPGAAGTTVRPQDLDNVECAPKMFYQAGNDAAMLGMHAEMHTTYGPNYLAILAAGALNAFNGFLTGDMIGNVASMISWRATLGSNEASYYAIEGLAGNTVEEAMAEAATHCSTLSLFSKFTLEGDYLWYAGTKVGLVKFLDHTLQILFLQGAIVAGATVRAVVTIGPYAASFLAQSAFQKAMRSSPGFMDIVAHSHFWEGGTEWSEEITSHGVSVADGILHPNILYRNPISWANGKFKNLWNASGQVSDDDPDSKVVKSVYDPCPAGYCVPNARDFSGITDKSTTYGFCGSTSVKTEDNDRSLVFPGLGMRNFWSGADPGETATNDINQQIMLVGDQGLYWTASPSINKSEDGQVGAYSVNFRGDSTYDYLYDGDGQVKEVQLNPRVVNKLKLQQSFALPVRPVREKR